MSRAAWLLAAFCLAAPAPARSQGVVLEQVDIGVERGRYRPGAWTPVRLQFAAGPAGHSGPVDLVVDGVPRLRCRIELPPHARADRVVLALFPYSTTFVSFQEEGGRALLPAPIRLHPVAPKRAWIAFDATLPAGAETGVVGDRATARLDPAAVPTREGAWDAFDALVLDRGRRAGLERDPEARAALEEWRAHGGMLVDAGALAGMAPEGARKSSRPGLGADGSVGGASPRDASLFAVPAWGESRRRRVYAFLGWVGLLAATATLLGAARPRSPGRSAAAAALAGAFLCVLWSRVFSPPAPAPARALGRCVVEPTPEGPRLLAEAWVWVLDPAKAPWGARMGTERGFHPLVAGDPGAGRSAPCLVLGDRERWTIPGGGSAEPVLLYRARRPAERVLPGAERLPGGRVRLRGLSLREAFLVEGQNVRWLGHVEEGVPAEPAAQAVPATLLVREHLAPPPYAVAATAARLRRMLDGLGPEQTWLVGRADNLDAVLPADRDPVESLGVIWALPLGG